MANRVSAGCGVIANELAQTMKKRGQKPYGVVNRTQVFGFFNRNLAGGALLDIQNS